MKRIGLLFCCWLVVLFVFGKEQTHRDSVRSEVHACLTAGAPDESVWSVLELLTEDSRLSSEDLESLFDEILFPFISIHEDKLASRTLAVAYRTRALVQSYLGHLEPYHTYMTMAYSYVDGLDDASPDDLYYKAAVCFNYAAMELAIGDVAAAHEAFYRSIRAAEKGRDYDKAMSGLYALAIYYTQTKDTLRLDKLLADMRDLCSRAGRHLGASSLYAWYSVATARYALEREKPAMRDSALFYSRQSLNLIEHHSDEFTQETANVAWNYYNHASLFTRQPFVNADSASYYLEKARAVSLRTAMHEREVELNVLCSYGTLYKSLGRYPQALDMFKQALVLMDADSVNNGIRQERLDAYENMVEVARKMGRYEEAFDYQQKLIDYHRTVYDTDLASRLEELSTKFRVEKKDMALRNLKERERSRTVAMRLLVAALVASLVSVGFLGWIYVLHRRRMHDRLYQAALEAEMHLQELDAVKSKYADLKDEVDARRMSRSFEVGVEKLKAIVRQAAGLDDSARESCLKKLSEADSAFLARHFASSLSSMTQMDVKYILCFYMEFDTRDIAALFNVEPASVYTVRYRLRKKFRGNPAFQFLMS